MDRIEIDGGIPLCGELNVQGSKNGALPVMAAAVLHRGISVIENCPCISDVEYMCEILRELGCRVFRDGTAVVIDAAGLHSSNVSACYATRLRASVVLMGSLLGRCGQAYLPYPGGCTIGRRPIELHLQALKSLGAEIFLSESGIYLKAKELCAAEIDFPFPSVGATENAILGAVTARGTTVLRGCAAEPEITELCMFLNAKGAKITGMGSDELHITGVEELRDGTYRLHADRIVAGTYLLAAAGTGGKISLHGVGGDQLAVPLAAMERMGAKITCMENNVTLEADGCIRPLPYIETAPYPGFPTDLQSQLLVCLCRADGVSTVAERLFESRFQITRELAKMGADITVDGNRAVVRGKRRLHGSVLAACELRGGAALALAALMAEGRSLISGIQYIRRGYEDIVRDLSALGANIKETI